MAQVIEIDAGPDAQPMAKIAFAACSNSTNVRAKYFRIGSTDSRITQATIRTAKAELNRRVTMLRGSCPRRSSQSAGQITAARFGHVSRPYRFPIKTEIQPFLRRIQIS
jgi:hypothetical protein